MIDWERVAELRSEIGPDGFAEVVELFLDEVEDVVMALGRKPGKLEDEMHFLKGSALNLGFRDFGAQCQKGEKLAASGHAGDVNLGEILDCYGASKDQFMCRLEEFTTAA